VKILVFEEIMINQFIQSFSTHLLDLFFKIITYFGSPIPWFVLGAWLFWLGKEKKSFTVMSLLLIGSFFSGLFKSIIARPRPEGIKILDNVVGSSFPSGHSTIAGIAAVYAFLSREIKKNFKYLILVLALLTAISRMYLGVHYLSDVIAGLFLGSIIALVVYKFEAKINKTEFHISKIREEFIIVIFFVALIVFNLFVPSEYYGAYALLGYFLGYAIYRHTKLAEVMVRAKTTNQKIVILFFGTAIFGVMGALAYFVFTGIIAQITFFSAGIFITLIWPIVISKFVKKREEVKANRFTGKAKKKINSKKKKK
jgi:undecaprenyl-diphosphatase